MSGQVSSQAVNIAAHGQRTVQARVFPGDRRIKGDRGQADSHVVEQLAGPLGQTQFWGYGYVAQSRWAGAC